LSRLNDIQVPVALTEQIEQLAMRAWPAAVVEPLGGWRLAFTDGLTTRRINSVQARHWQDGIALDAALERVESFYTARNLPARFRLTARSRPEGLDAWLAARGYQVEAPTDVMVADLGATEIGSTDHEVLLAPEPPAGWTRLWLASAAQDHATARRALLERMPSGTLFGLIRIGGAGAALGLLVLEGRWGGLFGMRTEPHFRRRGLGTALLGAFAREAIAQGAERLYLQVEQNNLPALALYRRTGFTLAYTYHYRARPMDRG
jgi:ribosomal protein S18 acetylase RimI-like enzyme